MNPTTRSTLLDLARRYLAAPCCDDGTTLARAVVAALDTPAPVTGRVWRKGEKCPIVAEGQRREDAYGTYTVGHSSHDGVFEVVTDTGRTRLYAWRREDIALEPLAEDWYEPTPLADTLPRVGTMGIIGNPLLPAATEVKP